MKYVLSFLAVLNGTVKYDNTYFIIVVLWRILLKKLYIMLILHCSILLYFSLSVYYSQSYVQHQISQNLFNFKSSNVESSPHVSANMANIRC
jgi:hypothetical protein